MTHAAAAKWTGPAAGAVSDFVAKVGFPVFVALALLWSALINQPAQLAEVVRYLERLDSRQVTESQRRVDEDARRTEALLQLVARVDLAMTKR